MGKSSSRSRSQSNKHKNKKQKKEKKQKKSPTPPTPQKKSKKEKDRKRSKERDYENRRKKRSYSRSRSNERHQHVPELKYYQRSSQPVQQEQVQKEQKDRKAQTRLARARALKLERISSDSDSDKEKKMKKEVKPELTEEQKLKIDELIKQRIILGCDSDGLEENEEDETSLIKSFKHNKNKIENQKNIPPPEDILEIDIELQELEQKQLVTELETKRKLEELKKENIDYDDTLDQYMLGIQKDAVIQIDPNNNPQLKEEKGEGDGEEGVDFNKNPKALQVITMEEIFGTSIMPSKKSQQIGITFEEDSENFFESVQRKKNDINGTKNNKLSDQQNQKIKIQSDFPKQLHTFIEEEEDYNHLPTSQNEDNFSDEHHKKEQEDRQMLEENESEEDAYYEQFKQALLQQKNEEKALLSEKEKEKEIDKYTKKLQADFLCDDDSEEKSIDFEQHEKNEKDADDYLKKISEKKVKKEIKIVDHEMIEYIKIRKNFYIESKEISEMTEEEVADYRKRLGDVQVRGKEVPRPILNWYQAGLSDIQLSILINEKQFKSPFPIQCQCLPIIMKGRDTIGVAETGSGKTLAYVLPLLRHVTDQEKLREGDGPIGLILAPTRELAVQIRNTAKRFCKRLGLNAVCVYGGAGIQGQLSELRKGAEIVVCTPGRLIDILTTSNGKIMNLQRVSMVIIDEADRMLDQGFEPQIRRILQNVRPDRQTVMFSATFPRNVETLAKEILIHPIEVIVGSRGQACKNIQQIIEVREECSKLRRLLEILGDWQEKGSVLIFVDKQTEADELYKELRKYGHPSLLLHGGIDATDREFTIRDFKKQVLNIMIATSVCSRGLDISHIALVVNFQCPNHMEDYIHRIGRTGRAGQKGTAITFITPQEDQYCLDLKKALELSKQAIPQALAEMVRDFKEKVEKGQAKIYTNKNLVGHNIFENENMEGKLEQIKKAMHKRYNFENGIENEDSDSDDIFLKTQSRTENTKERSLNQKLAMIENSQKRTAIMQKGFQAAQRALDQGLPQEKVIECTQNAIQTALNEYNPVKTLEQTIEDAAKLLDQFDKKEQENSDIVLYDFEINDYPPNARSKVMHRDFLHNMYELTGCQVSIRGIHIETGKRVPPGQKKLHLRIEGDTKYSVTNCYKELKKVIEEAAMKNLSIGGYLTQGSNRYTV